VVDGGMTTRGLSIEEIAVAAAVLSKNFASDVDRWWGSEVGEILDRKKSMNRSGRDARRKRTGHKT
jgi:hypothetical protein